MWAERGGLRPLVSWYKELVPSSQTHLRTSALDGGHYSPFCSPPARKEGNKSGPGLKPRGPPIFLEAGTGGGVRCGKDGLV